MEVEKAREREIRKGRQTSLVVRRASRTNLVLDNTRVLGRANHWSRTPGRLKT